MASVKQFLILFVCLTSVFSMSSVAVAGAVSLLEKEPGKIEEKKPGKTIEKKQTRTFIDVGLLKRADYVDLANWMGGLSASNEKQAQRLKELDELMSQSTLNEKEKERYQALRKLLKELGNKEPLMTSTLIKFFVLSVNNKQNKAIMENSEQFFNAVKKFNYEQAKVDELNNSSNCDDANARMEKCQRLMEQVKLLSSMSDVLVKTSLYNTTQLAGTHYSHDPSDPMADLNSKSKLQNALSRGVLQYSLSHAEKQYQDIKPALDKLIARAKNANANDSKIRLLQKVSKQIVHKFGFIGSYIGANKEMLRTNGTYRKKGNTAVFSAIRQKGKDRGRINAKALQRKMRDTFSLLAKFQNEIQRIEKMPKPCLASRKTFLSNQPKHDKKPAAKKTPTYVASNQLYPAAIVKK